MTTELNLDEQQVNVLKQALRFCSVNYGGDFGFDATKIMTDLLQDIQREETRQEIKKINKD